MNNTVITSAVELSLQLRNLLTQLSEEQYIAPLDLFAGSTIGQHTRHIIEFYQCLSKSHQLKSTVCYENRRRNLSIEQNTWDASLIVDELNEWLEKINNPFESLVLTVKDYQDDILSEWKSNTTLAREIHHCNEHAVHHLAIIKIGLRHYFPTIKCEDKVGVAKSTVAYKKGQ